MIWRDARLVIAAEWLKLRRSRATPIALSAYLAILGALYILYVIAARQSFMGIESGFFLAGATVSAATTPLSFVALMVVSFSVGREFSQGTIHGIWSKPMTRSGWLLGKIGTNVIHVSVFVVLTLVLTAAAAGLQYGFTDLMEKDYLIHAASALWWRFALLTGLTWLALIGVTVAAVIPALYLENPGAAVTVGIVAGFALQLSSRWNVLSPYLLPAYLGEPMQQFVEMSKGVPLPLAWDQLIQTCLIGSVVWIGLCWIWAWQIVRRKEVLN